jgi:hypothetical protein
VEVPGNHQVMFAARISLERTALKGMKRGDAVLWFLVIRRFSQCTSLF